MKEPAELPSKEGRKYVILLVAGFLVLLIWAVIDYAFLPNVPRPLILLFFLGLVLVGVGIFGVARNYPLGESAENMPLVVCLRALRVSSAFRSARGAR